MRSKYLDENISYLKLNDKIIDILKSHNILKIHDLWILNRKTLKSFDLTDSDIKQIIIKLELLGIDLNKKRIK